MQMVGCKYIRWEKYIFCYNDFHIDNLTKNLGITQQKYVGYINNEYNFNNSTNA
jgi:hypothetical protein